MQTVLIITLIILTLLNIKATVAIARCSSYDTHQKWLQAVLVWLFPIMGAMLILYVVKDFERKRISHHSIDENSIYNDIDPEHYHSGIGDISASGGD